MPDFSLEETAGGIVCGVDEVGRGPLAGPVVAAAALLDRDRLPEVLRDGLDDSKKLSARKREALYRVLTEADGVTLGIGIGTVAEIDSLNILRATHLAMARAMTHLVEAVGHAPDLVLVDGNQPPREFAWPLQCVVKGDGKSLSIAAASVAAKVTRDRMMMELAASFPGYGWERNMGYGTAEHREAIRRQGLTEHHRKSFSAQGDLFSAVAG